MEQAGLFFSPVGINYHTHIVFLLTTNYELSKPSSDHSGGQSVPFRTRTTEQLISCLDNMAKLFYTIFRYKNNVKHIRTGNIPTSCEGTKETSVTKLKGGDVSGAGCNGLRHSNYHAGGMQYSAGNECTRRHQADARPLVHNAF